MMLNKELLQGELPNDALSTVSITTTSTLINVYIFVVLQEQPRISEAQRKKEREMITKEVQSTSGRSQCYVVFTVD